MNPPPGQDQGSFLQHSANHRNLMLKPGYSQQTQPSTPTKLHPPLQRHSSLPGVHGSGGGSASGDKAFAHNAHNNQMSPHTPLSPDPVHDLPVELLQAGWRKFWSKREKMPYYFNKLTNESLWEMPQITAQVDSIRPEQKKNKKKFYLYPEYM